jgi:hypothetical protein
VALVKCIAPYGLYSIGDEVEIPDGAAYSTMFFSPVDPPEVPVASEPNPIHVEGPAE